MAKEFADTVSREFTIKEDGKVYGHVIVKPNCIGWKPPNGRKYKAIDIDDFAHYADKHGRWLEQ